MRKIVAGLFTSLDGAIEDAGQWIGPWFDPRLGLAAGSMIAAQDAMLLGWVTYEGSPRTGRTGPVTLSSRRIVAAVAH